MCQIKSGLIQIIKAIVPFFTGFPENAKLKLRVYFGTQTVLQAVNTYFDCNRRPRSTIDRIRAVSYEKASRHYWFVI